MHHYNQSFLFLPVQESERPSRLLPEILASIYMRPDSFGSMVINCLIRILLNSKYLYLVSIHSESIFVICKPIQHLSSTHYGIWILVEGFVVWRAGTIYPTPFKGNINIWITNLECRDSSDLPKISI